MESKRSNEDAEEAGQYGPPNKLLKIDKMDLSRSDSLQSNNSDRSGKSDSSGSTIDQQKEQPLLLPTNADDDEASNDSNVGYMENDDDDDDEVILNYQVEQDTEDYEGPTFCDGVDVPKKMECHHLFAKPTHTAFSLFNVKRLLVHHDFILFPYCLEINGVAERVSKARVSHIIRSFQNSSNDTRYQQVQEDLNILKQLIDSDTSTRDELEYLARSYDARNFFASSKQISRDCEHFGDSLYHVFRSVRRPENFESDYRTMFAKFLTMIAKRLDYNVLEQSYKSASIKIKYPLKKCEMTLSGRADIRLQHVHNGSVAVLVEVKRYRPVNIIYSSLPLPNPDGKLKPKLGAKVSFNKVAETADKTDMRRIVRENMYKDLDKNMCRHLKKSEKGFFGKVIAQLVGELLAWFDTSTAATQHDHIQAASPELQKKKKMVRYGICQIGFKIIFVTIGINSDYIGKYPFIRIGASRAEGLGVDAFITRPFDLMKADDRSTIADIIFAMLYYCTP